MYSTGVGVANVWRRNSREAEALERASRANESLSALMSAIQNKSESERAQSHADAPNKDRLSRTDTATPPPSQALRSELKFLQDGLLNLKQAIATRKFKGHRPVFMQKPRQPPSRTPSPPNYDLNQQESPFEETYSQTDSAAPSAAIQTQIMTSITALANRLRRLEENNADKSQRSDSRLLKENEMSPLLETASTAVLQSELTHERLTRMQLVAVLSALLGKENSSHLQTLPYLPELEALNDAQLRLVIRQMSARLEDLTRHSVSAKTKAVELAAALKTIKDLSGNIVELEERLNSSPPEGDAAFVEKMSLRLRAQTSRLRAMSRELEIFRRVFSSASLEIVGGDEETRRLAVELVSDKATSPSPSPSRKKKKSRSGDSPPTNRYAFEDATTPQTEEAESPRQRIKKALTVNEHEIDAAVSLFSNSGTSKVKLVKIGPGLFLFGRLNVRVTLSANSKTPLAFCDGKKYSLKRFVTTFEAQEYAAVTTTGVDSCAKGPIIRHPSGPSTLQSPARPARHSTFQTPEKHPQARDGPRGTGERDSPSKQLEVFRWLKNGSKQKTDLPRIPMAGTPSAAHRTPPPRSALFSTMLSTTPSPSSLYPRMH